MSAPIARPEPRGKGVRHATVTDAAASPHAVPERPVVALDRGPQITRTTTTTTSSSSSSALPHGRPAVAEDGARRRSTFTSDGGESVRPREEPEWIRTAVFPHEGGPARETGASPAVMAHSLAPRCGPVLVNGPSPSRSPASIRPDARNTTTTPSPNRVSVTTPSPWSAVRRLFALSPPRHRPGEGGARRHYVGQHPHKAIADALRAGPHSAGQTPVAASLAPSPQMQLPQQPLEPPVVVPLSSIAGTTTPDNLFVEWCVAVASVVASGR